MTAELKPTRLTCEYLNNPLGLTVETPRLSWIVDSERRGARQTAYQILVAGELADLNAQRGTLWDSGKVQSSRTTHIPYAGRPLRSGERCWWGVRVWGTDTASPYSSAAFWQMGLLDPEDWAAQWIGLERAAPEPAVTDLPMLPAVYLRRTFTVAQPVMRATLYATAQGVYRPYLNGERVGAAELPPGWTDYRRRVQVQAYDVTDALQVGENALGVVLGDGWYSGYLGFKGVRAYYGQHPRALLQLEVAYLDGSTDTIATDDRWRGATGPILYSDIQMGEWYDARREMPGWATVYFAADAWRPVVVEPRDPDVLLVGQPNRSIQVTQDLHSASVTPYTPEDEGPVRYIFDLGQNMVGRVRLNVEGEAGTEVRMRFGEVLEPDGGLHTANLRSARATDTYVLRGDGPETYEPTFTYHGFRYVEVTGYPGEPARDAITGRVMHNAMPYASTFECSHPLVNRLWKNILWGQRGNFVSVPTDCPQRDERLGWTGDAQIFCRTATFNMDVAAFFTKWLADMRDAQLPNGAFTDVVPQFEGMPAGAPAWGDAGVIIPWTLYRVYGDTRLIREHYPAMQRWMNYIAEANPFYLRTKRLNNNYSDWVALERGSSAEQIATAYWAKIAGMMAEMADAIGRSLEAANYHALYETIRQAFITAYVLPDGRIETGTQTAYALALDNDLVPEELRDAAAARLAAAVERRDGHLATGFLGTPALCFALTEHGYRDVAYRLLTQETFPSWLYMVKQGATTMWERWNAYTEEKGIHDPGMNSFNHYAYGAIGEWLYRVVAGIEVGAPGYAHIRLRPRPGGGLTYAQASYDTVHGYVASGWRLKDGRLHYHVTLPANTTATLDLPTVNPTTVREGEGPAATAAGVRFVRYAEGVATFELQSGTYHFIGEQA